MTNYEQQLTVYISGGQPASPFPHIANSAHMTKSGRAYFGSFSKAMANNVAFQHGGAPVVHFKSVPLFFSN